MFKLFLLLHLIGVIVGSGPTFVFPIIQKECRNIEELKYVHRLMGKIGRFPFWGDMLILFSGIGMMWVTHTPFSLTFNWLTVSIILFALLRSFSSFIAPIYYKKADAEFFKLNDVITPEYIQAKQMTARLFWFGQTILVAIILLMILKPF